MRRYLAVQRNTPPCEKTEDEKNY